MLVKQRLFTLFTGLLLLLSALPAQALDVTARLHWSQRVEMSTPVSGVIQTVNVRIGQRVKKGAVLVSLDQRGFKAKQKMAQAKVNNLKEVQLEAKRQQDRAQELYDRTVLSDHDLQVAKNGYTAARSGYQTAQAELVQAKLDLEYSNLRAPFDAIVLQRSVEVGQTVISQLRPEPLLVVAASEKMIARGLIEQDDLNGDIHGKSATVIVDGKTYPGKVLQVGLEPVKSQKSGTFYAIEVEFTTGQRTLRAGQEAKIKLP